MKYLNQLLFIVFLFSSICYSQITNSNELYLVKTARFIHSQQHAFNVIKFKFPEQRATVENTETAFNKNFKTAIKVINTKTKKLLGDKYESFLTNLNNELNESSIDDLKNNLQEPIESPVIETLLAYKYQDNPVDEFLENHIDTYTIKSHENFDKVNLSIQIPKSWKDIGKGSPASLKKFRSELGTGNVTVTLSTKNIPIKNSAITQVSQHELTNYKSKAVQNKHIVEHLYLSESNVLQIKCVINNTTDSDLNFQYQKFNPLFKSIVKSIRLIKKIENSSLLTTTSKKL